MKGYIEVEIYSNCDKCPFGRKTGVTTWVCDVVDILMPVNPYENKTHSRPYWCPIKENK